mgnify:CR=1 FL=1
MTATPHQPSRRRRLIVDRAIQLPFVKALVLVLCVVTAACLAAVFLAVRITLSTYELANDALIVALLNTVFWLVMVELVVLLPFVIWFGVWVTHKVAGPLVRIQAALAQMSRGDYQVHMRLRKGDRLMDLAELINRLAEEIRRRSP